MVEQTVYEKLTRELDEALLNTYREAKKLGYTSSQFFQKLSKLRGVEAAKYYINMPPAYGNDRLEKMNRLDLSVEAVVVENEKFHVLFEPAEIERARKRLIGANYTPKRYTSS